MHPKTSRTVVLASLLIALPLLTATPDAGGEDEVPPRDGTRYIVGFHEVPRHLEPGDHWNGALIIRIDTSLHFLVVEPRDPEAFAAQTYAQSSNVRCVEEDRVVQWIRYTPNDPRFGDQYGPQQVRAPEAWDTTLGDPSKSVCIVDTGVRYTHEDLSGARWLGGIDYVNNDNDPNDDNGHGTHVAGSAAASIDNGLGIAGIANVGIYGVKVLNALGSGSFSDVASGISWCADNGADVINLSLGASSGTTALREAVEYAWGKGKLVIAAAGNDGPCTNCVNYPGAYPDAIAVTCTTASESFCSFSSQGPEAELAAPGNGILSTCRNSDTSYCNMSGTSMSSPHVAGVAALVWSHVNELTNAELRTLLQDNAKDLGPAGWDEQFGHGLVDAKATLDAAGDPTPPPPEPPLETIYAEDFDGGNAPGWTLDGLWHVSSSCTTPPSAPNYLGYHRTTACDYNTGARSSGSARFNVDLSDATAARLEFSHFYHVESFNGEYDVMRVQVSTNGGSSWTTLDQWDARDETNGDWSPESFDLDAHVGGTLDVRFFFDTMDGSFNDFPGWHIDDVTVLADAPGDPPGNDPPVADAGPDQTLSDDDGSGAETADLDGSGSSDPDGTITSWEWLDSGGSVIATGETAQVSLGVGTHEITLVVTDDDGATGTDTVIITVQANQAPTATFTHGCTDLTCSFDASGSSDPDGSIASYAWDFGDGNTGMGATPSHAYAAAGTYTVTLTVTDNGGATDDATDTVQPTNPNGPDVVYFEDFDAGSAPGWHKSGGSTDLWRVASDCVTPASGSHQLAFARAAPNCDYDVGHAVGWARSPVIDLSGYGTATLSFDHFYHVESASGVYDVMRLQVSGDSGSSWTTLDQWDSTDGTNGGYAPESYDVSAYIGNGFRVRFHFDSQDGLFNDHPGWYVDNVQVTAE